MSVCKTLCVCVCVYVHVCMYVCVTLCVCVCYEFILDVVCRFTLQTVILFFAMCYMDDNVEVPIKHLKYAKK